MTIAQVQIHGYRKGHQLLASSIVLTKDDQSVVDRLSDVAGPLRPKETFAPYFSAYPLPSGTNYVVAKTWQDLSVARAGCVRTMSVLVDAQTWSYEPPIRSILRLLQSSVLPTEADAVAAKLDEGEEVRFPSALNFNANELLEALFLEDAKPVVVFDAPNPDLIAMRLLTALWPGMRRKFALSTFALSPRKARGRDFDLVFAPSTAKTKFSDWPGRRLDGRSIQEDRHRWTGTIARLVFEEPVPKLLSDRNVSLLGKSEADSAAALRIALLWDELLGKLGQTPTAALGLLDIANSGLVSGADALNSIEPKLVESILRAGNGLLPDTAWEFVSAISRKIHEHEMANVRNAVKKLAEHLSERAPEGVVQLLREPDPEGAIAVLLPSLAGGLSRGAAPQVEKVLLSMPADALARLVAQSGSLAERVAHDDQLLRRMGALLVDVEQGLAQKVGVTLLPFLVEDRHLPAATPIFEKLDAREVARELTWLGKINAFNAKLLGDVLISRARNVGGIVAAREALISADFSAKRNELLAQTISPVESDITWLVNERRLTDQLTVELLEHTLRQASTLELSDLFSSSVIADQIIALLPADAIDILLRVNLDDSLPINTYITIFRALMPKVKDVRKVDIAQRALNKCLTNRFDGDEIAVLAQLFGILGARLDGPWVASVGLKRESEAAIANRNLTAFDRAPAAARTRLVEAVDEIAYAIKQRHFIDLDEAAGKACANLMLDAAKISTKGVLLYAAGCLLPSLLRARHQPISKIIAVLFPVIYYELANAKDVPDLVKFVPFLDWDRCKAARRELVYAFMDSSWRPGDLALTAYRCNDVAKILKRVAASYGGNDYLEQINHDLECLDDDEKTTVQVAIADVRADISYKFDW